MNLLKKIALVAVLLAVGVGGFLHVTPRQADAVTDDWSGHSEHFVHESGVTATGTGAGMALIDTAVSGTVLNIRSLYMDVGTSGTVTIYDGNAGTGATILWTGYITSHTPLRLTGDDLGQGLKSTAGNGIYCVGAGTITFSARVRTQ